MQIDVLLTKHGLFCPSSPITTFVSSHPDPITFSALRILPLHFHSHQGFSPPTPSPFEPLYQLSSSFPFPPWHNRSSINLYIHAELLLASLLSWSCVQTACVRWLCGMMEYILSARQPPEPCSTWIYFKIPAHRILCSSVSISVHVYTGVNLCQVLLSRHQRRVGQAEGNGQWLSSLNRLTLNG